MSNLNSLFDVVRGWPNSSALQLSFKQKDLVTPDIEEGTVVAVEDESGVPVIDRHTSAADASGNVDEPWLVMRGLDEEDAGESQKLACVKLRTGVMFRVATSEEVLPNDPIYANAGVLTKVDPGSAPLLGRVVDYHPVEGWMVVES
mgnify:CR=1 FL=1